MSKKGVNDDRGLPYEVIRIFKEAFYDSRGRGDYTVYERYKRRLQAVPDLDPKVYQRAVRYLSDLLRV